MDLIGGKCPDDAVANMNPKLIRQKRQGLLSLVTTLCACVRMPDFGLSGLGSDHMRQHQHVEEYG
jgi:hypothetical protein